jgi:DNA-directed RNA polymerase specialized sigma24 family protein
MDADRREQQLPCCTVRWIRERARRLAGHYGWGPSDREDIEQELSLNVWLRLPKYDSAEGSFEDFVHWLIKRAVATLVERQMAKKRGQGRRPRSLDIAIGGPEGGTTSASEVMDEAQADRRLGLDRRHFTAKCDLSVEFREFLGTLGPDLRDLCERLLQNPNFTDISRDTGIPRATLYERREELARLMEKAGLREYHPSSGASDGPPVAER